MAKKKQLEVETVSKEQLREILAAKQVVSKLDCEIDDIKDSLKRIKSAREKALDKLFDLIESANNEARMPLLQSMTATDEDKTALQKLADDLAPETAEGEAI